MASSPILLEEILRFWHFKGVPPCAEAQADGVPCPTLGRQCETCAQAIQAVTLARRAGDPVRQEPGS
jgi:hypothetical protein